MIELISFSFNDMTNPKSILLKSAVTLGVIACLTPLLFKAYVLACMYWTLNVQADPYKPWDGCADPTSQAELNAWIAHSEATGEPMCDPEAVNMTFDEPKPNSNPDTQSASDDDRAID